MQIMYELRMLTPLSENMALRAAAEPMLISVMRQLRTREMMTALSGIASRGWTYCQLSRKVSQPQKEQEDITDSEADLHAQ